jgi:cytochrome c-type biogenesis protein CcmE
MSRGIRLLVAGLVVCGALGALAVASLGDSLVYYLTPSEVGAKHPDGRVRLGGMVQPGSVTEADGLVSFVLTDGAADISVVHQGDPPGVFQEGQGAIVEGDFAPDGVFRSDVLIVKHSNEYREKDGSTYKAPTTSGGGG